MCPNFSDPTKALPRGDLGSLRGRRGSPRGHKFCHLGEPWFPLEEPRALSRKAVMGSLNLQTYRALVTKKYVHVKFVMFIIIPLPTFVDILGLIF